MKNKKQDEEEIEKVLKSKYGQKDRLRTTAAIHKQPSKIRLTDLCPEQKLKVGELIKINESRRLQIQQLSEQASQLRARLVDAQTELNHLEQLLTANSLQNQQKQAQIKRLIQLNAEKDKDILQLTTENKKYCEENESKSRISFENKCLQTQQIMLVNEGTQTKKHKTKQRLIQTEELRQYPKIADKYTRKKHQSKSFEGSQGSSRKPYPRNYSQKQSLNSHHNSSEDKAYYKEADKLEQDVNECFEDLTEKWLELKEKNLNKLKLQYQESRQKFYQESEFGMYAPAHLITEEHQQGQAEEDPEGIDDLQLNKLLKSKNFSASRLLISKAMGESQNSRKKSYYMENMNTEQTKVDEPKQSSSGKVYPLKLREKDPLNKVLYEEDLMDLVDSLQ